MQIIYNRGQEGIPQDDAEALKWFSKAASKEDQDAQFHLGLMYDKGRGISQRYAEAIKWYSKVADKDPYSCPV